MTDIEGWIKEFEQVEREPNKTVKFLVGCKKDLSQRQVTTNEAMVFAKRHSLEPFECSAKTGEGIAEIFDKAISSLYSSDSMRDINPIANIVIVDNTSKSVPQRPVKAQPVEAPQPVDISKPVQNQDNEGSGCC